MNYEKMSDFEINNAAAEALGLDTYQEDGKLYASIKHIGENITSVSGVVDYCNNPADAWPVIRENLISLSPCYSADNSTYACENTGKWCAEHMTLCCDQVKHENPLRAAMIVFLMMQEAAQ